MQPQKIFGESYPKSNSITESGCRKTEVWKPSLSQSQRKAREFIYQGGMYGLHWACPRGKEQLEEKTREKKVN